MIKILSGDTDQQLWQKAIHGDLQAFESLYNRYWELLLREGYKVLRNREEAEDVVQNLFVDLYNRLGMTEVNDIKGYLLQANRYAIYKRIRQYIAMEKYRIDLPEDFCLSGQAMETGYMTEYAELERALAAGIARLPEKCREVFLLSRNHGLSYAQIALQLGISERTVEKHISKALRLLRDGLSADYGHYFCAVVIFSFFL